MRVTMHLNTAPAGTVFPGGTGGLELGRRLGEQREAGGRWGWALGADAANTASSPGPRVLGSEWGGGGREAPGSVLGGSQSAGGGGRPSGGPRPDVIPVWELGGRGRPTGRFRARAAVLHALGCVGCRERPPPPARPPRRWHAPCRRSRTQCGHAVQGCGGCSRESELGGRLPVQGVYGAGGPDARLTERAIDGEGGADRSPTPSLRAGREPGGLRAWRSGSRCVWR